MAPHRPFVVLKFGGTSVSTAARWRTIHRIVRERLAEGLHPVLVCSATAGSSDRLEAMARLEEDAEASLEALVANHHALARELGVPEDTADADLDALAAVLDATRTLREVSPRTHARLMATGELASTRLGAAFLAQQGLHTTWVDARTMLKARHAPEVHADRRWLAATCRHDRDAALGDRLCAEGDVTITQGFIARDPLSGDTVLLGRGGSDTSAAYLAALLGAARLEIWTDVDGLYSAHPGVVPDARRLDRVSYDAAASLATLGASVLHPRCLGPVREAGIPLHVRCTLDPSAPGTVITDADGPAAIQAVTHRTGLHLVRMRRDPEWQAVGYLADVTTIFRDQGLSIDLLASSSSLIQATIDGASAPLVHERLDALAEALAHVCEAEIVRDVASVSLVGRGLTRVLATLGPALAEADAHRIGLVVPGADDAHLTFVVRPQDAEALTRRLHEAVLGDAIDTVLPRPLGKADRQEAAP